MNNRRTVGGVRGGWKPALCLFVLAPMAGELITSSAPPLVFFIPWVFLLFALLYGCGAILIREMAIRWNSGWIGILLMGAAYGILEEGLGAKSFFDPHWRALGSLGSYGRWLGVNWVWTIGLTLFHAGFCIAVPILAASLPFPQLRQSRWLGGKSLAAVAAAYFFVLLLFYQKGNENGYQAPKSYYLVSLAVAVALIAAAALWGRRHAIPTLVPSEVPPARLGLLGFAAIIAFVLILYALPSTGVPAWFTGGLLIGLAMLVTVFLRRWSDAGNRSLTPWQEFALVAGAIGAFAIQAPFQEWNPGRGDSARGMTLVGIACAVYIYWLRAHVRHNLTPTMDRRNHVS